MVRLGDRTGVVGALWLLPLPLLVVPPLAVLRRGLNKPKRLRRGLGADVRRDVGVLVLVAESGEPCCDDDGGDDDDDGDSDNVSLLRVGGVTTLIGALGGLLGEDRYVSPRSS